MDDLKKKRDGLVEIVPKSPLGVTYGAPASSNCCCKTSAPVKFSELTKSTKDLLEKHFPAGVVELEVNTTASNGVKFTATGVHDEKVTGIEAELKAKYTNKANGLCMTNKWTSQNVLGVELDLCDSIVDGLKLGVNSQFFLLRNSVAVRVNGGYRRDWLNMNASLDVFGGPTVSADAVVKVQGLFAGVDVTYDVPTNQLSKYDVAVGMNHNEYSLAVMAKKQLSVFSASVFHRARPDLLTGCTATWDKGAKASNVVFDFGSQYHLDRDAFVKGKIDSNGRIGLSYTQNLRSFLKVTLGCLIDSKHLGQNSHKLGLSVTFDG